MMRSLAAVVVLWLMTLSFALVAGVVMEESIRADIGASLIHEELRASLDLGWLEEFWHRRGGLAVTLTPTRLSSAAVFDNLELWFSGEWVSHHRGLAALGLLFLMSWILMQGGLLNHLARPGSRFSLGSFLGAGGSYFFRFFRLALLAGAGYYGVYRTARWLFASIERWSEDVTAERTALAWYLLATFLVLWLMVIVHLLSEYAKIATVREQRRSVLLAVLRSLGQLLRHPLQAFGLHTAMAILLLAAQGLYFWAAPDLIESGSFAVLLAFLAGQSYLLVRWALRVVRYGAELTLFDEWTGRTAIRRGGISP